MGIAGPDGSPAWAKPKASTRPFKHEHGHEHNSHKNFHCSHHHNYPHAGFQGGPEYLVPMGTPIPNPYGPGIVFLPPKDPRIIPCRPAENLGHFDYDDLDTIEGDRLHHQGRHPVFEDPNGEYAPIKLRAEQNERARIEEIERDQALRNARKKEYQKNVWLKAMGAKQDQPDSDATISTHHTAEYDERVININVRQPCDKCQELVTVETVHRRLSLHEASQGIGIDLDSPAPKRVKEFLCEKCEVSEAEEKKNADLLRKLVRQVVAEAGNSTSSLNWILLTRLTWLNYTDTIKKAKENGPSLRATASHGRRVIHSEHPQSLDPRAALKEPLLHHGKNKSSRFENMPQDAALSNPTPHGRQSKHHVYGHTEANISDVYRDESDDEYQSAKEARVTQPRSSTNLGNRLSHSILAAFDREHIVNKDNIRIISSKGPEDDEEEEEVIVIRRARRHNDKNHNENRSHPTLVKSATENPEEALEALTRRLAHRLALSPTKADSFHDATNLRNHTKEMYQEIESGSDSSGYSAFVRKHQRSRAHAHQRQTHNRANHHNRGAHTHTTNHHEPHRQHYRERIVEYDDENHPHYQRRRRTRPEDKPGDPSSNTTAGFFF
ncbi:hypothetical protein TWF173_007999 [Orbilia oligospora]|nr:hypothetical protein TWF173_007999 [Orbilia oligospora]